MKQTLCTKALLCFLLFGIACFFVVATFTSKLSLNRLEKEEREQLYQEAVLVASDFSENYANQLTISKETQTSLTQLGNYLDSSIWVIYPNKTVLFSSSTKAPSKVPDFQASDFGTTRSKTGDFYGCFDEEHLSVLAPILVDYRVCGYVLIHKPLQQFYITHNNLLDVSYLSLCVISLLTGLLFLAFVFGVYKPLKRISEGAKEYALGHYENQIAIHKNDSEMNYIAVSLNYMADKLKTIEDKQRKFISNVSHDFRSPLTSIRGYVDAMLDGTIPVEMQEKYLNIILFETERLTKLTESLLELNKYESKSIILDVTDFDLHHIIQKTLETFEGSSKEKHISFELFFDKRPLFVLADMGKIQQVLYNLIDNAIKFSHPDSFIIIETTTRNGKVYFSIKDSGIGIPRDSITKIWDRFYKTDVSRGKDKRGTGLGLSIVKEIILAHDENINVISTEGVGTEFIFTLPLA